MKKVREGEARLIGLGRISTLFIVALLLSGFLAVFQFLPAHASRLFSDGFESGSFSAWSGTDGTPSIVTSPVHSGTYAAKFVATTDCCYKTFTKTLTTYLRAYIYYTGTMSSGQYVSLIWLRDPAGGNNLALVYIENDAGTCRWGIRIMSPNIGWFWSTQQKPSASTWYCVELRATCGSTGEYRVFINGNELTDITHTNLNTGSNGATLAFIYPMDGYSGLTIYADDCVVADTYIGVGALLFSNMSASAIFPGQACLFSCLVSGNNVSYYVFSTNNTGTWVNDTAIAFAAGQTSAWANVTKTLTSIVGAVVYYEWYANDTSNNWGTGGQALTTNQFTIKAPLPSGCSDLPGVSYNGSVYVFGGYGTSPTNYLSSVYCYDPAKNSWVPKTNMTYARWGGAAAVYNGIAYMFGGADGASNNRVEAYNFTSNTWITKNNLPADLVYQSGGQMAATVGSYIYIFNKQNVYQYNPATDTYTQKTSNTAMRRWGTCAYVNVGGDDRVYIIGGYDDNTGTGVNTVYYYSVTSNSWTLVSGSAPYSAYGTTRDNPVINGFIFYGYGNDAPSTTFYSYAYSYNPADNTWTSLGPGNYPRDGVACAVVNGILYVIGGRNVESNPYGLTYNEACNPQITDTIPPTFGSITANTTVAGEEVNLSCTVSDNVAVSSYAYSWNNTGSWTNQTAVSVSSSSVTATLTGTWNSTSGNTVAVKIYANDTSNNWNTSPQYNFTVTAASASKLVFTAGANQSLTAGQLSTAITVQRQDQIGNPFTSGSVTVNLASTSLGATFYSDAGNTPASSVTISNGFSTVNFWYNDTAIGTPTLTVSASGLTSANTTFVIASAVIFSDGFESGDGSAWNKGAIKSNGIVSYVNSPVHHGNWAMESQITAAGASWAVNYAEYGGYATLYFRAYVRFTTLPANGEDTALVQFETSAYQSVAFVGLGYSGGVPQWEFYYTKGGVGSYSTIYAGTPTTNVWHCLEVMTTVDAVNGKAEGYVDGIKLFSDSGYKNDYIGNNFFITLGFDTWKASDYVNTGYFDCAVVSTQYIGPEVSPARVLTVSTVGSGSVNLNNTGPYYDGDVVKLTAIPVTGWSFQSWSGNLTGSANPAVLTIMGNMTVTATFTQNQYNVSVTVLPSSAAGTVTPNATGPYHYNDVVVLTESPSLGYTFSGWSGDGSGTGSTRSVTVTGNMAVTATFTQNQYTLTVTVVGNGTVSKSPNQATYTWGTNVSLTANANVGWTFAGWSGDVSGTVNPVTINMTGNMAVTATFTQDQYTLTITTAGTGSVDRNPSQATYIYGTVVTLTANPAVGWSFANWTGDLSGTANPTTINMTGNKAVAAVFTRNTYTLVVDIVGNGNVNLNNTGPYYYGDFVQLTATPNTGWSFDHWSGDLSGSVNPATIRINGNMSVTATFAQDQYLLTMYTTGQGSVVPGNQTFASGTVVDIKAINALGWAFAGWSGGASGLANTTVTMNGPVAVTATFTQDHYTLTVDIVGHGSVGKSPDQTSYVYGDTVTLTATADAGWTFAGWTGAPAGNPTTITVTGNTVVTATFTQNNYTVSVTVLPFSAAGTVTPNGTGPYHYDDLVVLTESASAGYTFSGWSGDGSGTGSTRLVTVTGNMSVTAIFTQNTYTLTVTTSGSGSVVLNNTGPYHYGDTVQLTANPIVGWSFSAWSGDLSGSANPMTLVINGDKTVTASFTQNAYTLTVSTVGSGSVNKNSTGPYHYGDVVELTAVPTTGWSFQIWSGDLLGSSNPATILINGNKTVTATFNKNTYTLTVTTVGSGSVNLNNTGPYYYGDVVQLTAVPATGWSFDHWGEDLSGSVNPTTLVINGNKAVTATFAQNVYTLTVTTTGSGSVNLNNTGPYHYSDVVELTAVPAAGWSFQIWSGDLLGSTNPSTIVINGNKVVTATFSQDAYSLTVSTVGSGSVVKVPDQASYHLGDVVLLTATPDAGWSFSAWGGALTGSANPAGLTVTGNLTVTATFAQDQYPLTMYTTGQGSVVPGNQTFASGTVVDIKAINALGWAFAGWSGGASGSANTTVTMNGPVSVTATFTQNAYTLTVTTAGNGFVNLNNSGPYYFGDVVELTAVPLTGWSFQGWSGDVLGSANPSTIVINGNMAVTATFTQNAYVLTVSTVGSGSVVKVPDQASYHYGDVVQLTASPSAGWSFSGWSGDFSSSVNPVNVIINGTTSVTATFTQNTYTLTVTTVGTGSVNLNNTGPYYYGDVVELTAVPAVGWSFQSWSGDLTGSENPASITMDGHKSVTATFAQIEYTLTVSASPVEGGSVNKSPDSSHYHYNDVVQLTAIPSAGYSFSAWGGALSGSANPASLTVTGDMAVTATFTQNTYTLTVTTSGSGSVVLNNTGPYHYGDTVQFTAIPATGWSFDHWSGDLSGSVNPTTILIDGSKGVTATFTQNVYTLTVTTVGSGSVVKVPDQASYHYGDSVQLTATPTAGWSFSAWSGDISGPLNPVSVTINGTTSVTATFTQNTYSLTVSTVGSGSVNLNNSGPYHYGDVVELTAVPSAGWSFDHWNGDLSGSANPSTILIDGNKATTATFTQLTYALSVGTVEGGLVNLNNSGPYYFGDVVELTAVPVTGWSFQSWSGDLLGSANPATIVINGNKAVSATFTQNTYTLTVTTVGSGSVNLNNTGPYYYGDIVELTAVPTVGWSFQGWSGNLSGSTNPTTILMDGNKAVTATFTQGQYTLTVTVVGSGSVSRNNSGPYHYGDVIEVTAVPVVGWSFDHWSGNLSGTANPTALTITGDKAVTATFTQGQYTLTVTTVGSGSVNRNNTGPHHYGDVVQLTAVPTVGWSFQSWSGDLSGSVNPSDLTITGDMSVTATFTQDAYSLTVSTAGSGSVVKVPDQASYHLGDVVLLTATPDAGWSFSAWSGNISGSVNPVNVTINGTTSVTATFTQNPASRLTFAVGAAQSLTAGQLSSVITVQRQDQYGNPVTSGSTTVSLRSTSGQAIFYSDAGITKVTSVTINEGQSQTSFWYNDTLAGSPTLTASSSGLISATTTFAINAGIAVKLVFIAGASQTLHIGQLSSVITVQRQDQYGNPVTSGSTTVSLGCNSRNAIFYSDAGVTETKAVTIKEGSSTVNFWFKATAQGSPTLTASAPTLTSASTKFKINK